MKRGLTRRWIQFLWLCLLAISIVTCSADDRTISTIDSGDTGLTDSALQIWWTQGFLPEENAVIDQIMQDWQRESGMEGNLMMLPDRNILQDTQQALEEGRSPDVLFSFAADTNLIPLLAWQDKLADLSALILPQQKEYDPVALKSVYYQNNVTQQRSYYALPIGEGTVYLHHWHDLVEQAGFEDGDLPTDWDAFWQFWQTVQQRLQQQRPNTYALGFALSDLGTDTYWNVEHFLEAYNVQVVDEAGALRIDTPENRKKIATIIQTFADLYRGQVIPPAATEWTDSGNNVSFLQGESLLTANNTMSIPFTQKQPQNPYNRLSTDLYFDKIHTTPWPNNPNGEPHRSILSIEQVVVLKDAKHREAAESFLAFFNRPENINRFLKEANKGRIFPAKPALLADPFWNNPDDPHLSVALQQLRQNTRPSYQVYAPAYSRVLQQNVWAKAILQVIEQGLSPEQATDNAIKQINQIFAELT